jgi:lipopolysaccharide export system permease protein
MLVSFFVPVFLVFLALFVMVFELMDIFSNLWRYINHEAALADIARIAWLYLPKCISYSLPVALLFSVAYAMGSYYVHNELISVFSAGVNLASFVSPLIVIGLMLSVGSFFFEDAVVIRTFRSKNEYSRTILNQTVSYSNTNVTVSSADGRFLYQAAYYNDKQGTLNGVTVIERDAESDFTRRMEANFAEWNGSHWTLRSCRVFERDGNGQVDERWVERYEGTELTERPSIFRRISEQVEEMRVTDAGDYIESLRRAGLPYQEPLSHYHRKYSFALTPLIVVLIAGSIGGLLKGNFLFLSLLGSLGIVVVYYVVQMVAMALARNGYLSPVVGAWASPVLFMALGVLQFRKART